MKEYYIGQIDLDKKYWKKRVGVKVGENIIKENWDKSITYRSFQLNVKKKLLSLYGYKCGYCGCELTDHKLVAMSSYYPLRLYEDSINEDNFVLACPICNRIKAGKDPKGKDGEILILHPYTERYQKEIQFDENGIAYGTTKAAQSTIEILHLNRPELVAYRASNVDAFIEKFNDNKTSKEVYENSIIQITNLLKVQIATEELKEYYYRIIYANVIASMESYLSKTLIMLVLSDKELFWQFVRNFKWNKDKIEISKIKEEYDNMHIKVKTALTELLYHDLSKVKKVYANTLEIDILTNKEDMNYLCKAVSIRHDIVHRNGRKKSDSGADCYHVIGKEEIEGLITKVNALVESIENQINLKGYEL